MTDKLMYILKDDTKINFLRRLKLVVETFEHSNNEPINQNSIKVAKPTNKRNVLYKNSEREGTLNCL